MTAPTIRAIRRLLVVGAGTMGSQIGMVAALARYDVTVHDIDAAALDHAETHLRRQMDRSVARGRATRDDVEAAFARLELTTILDAAASAADFVIEAAVERLEVKRDLFARLDAIAPPHAILATNSSTYPSSQIAEATQRPDRICNMHFFNPALLMACVEVVGNPQTSKATLETTVALTRRLGKQPVVLRREIPGFVANRLLWALRDEAIALYEGGVATIEDIDTAARTALGHPMGPFELMDLVGIDVAHHVQTARFQASGNLKDRPSRSLTEQYESGRLGRKTGRGWYVYDDDGRKITP